jgi:hypothetical protein
MLDNSNQPVIIQGLNKDLVTEVQHFLHGAVHYWCKTHNYGDQFSFNTFMNDATDDCWKYTPLINLYNLYNTGIQPLAGTVDPAMTEAAKKGGMILKNVLLEEIRNFKTVSHNPNNYTLA